MWLSFFRHVFGHFLEKVAVVVAHLVPRTDFPLVVLPVEGELGVHPLLSGAEFEGGFGDVACQELDLDVLWGDGEVHAVGPSDVLALEAPVGGLLGVDGAHLPLHVVELSGAEHGVEVGVVLHAVVCGGVCPADFGVDGPDLLCDGFFSPLVVGCDVHSVCHFGGSCGVGSLANGCGVGVPGVGVGHLALVAAGGQQHGCGYYYIICMSFHPAVLSLLIPKKYSMSVRKPTPSVS